MKKINIAIVFGGRSGEHEVSLVSATSVIKALDPKKYSVIPIGITKTGKFLTGPGVLDAFKKNKLDGLKTAIFNLDINKPGIIVNGKFYKIDVVFPVLHGPYGEDGTIQGLFEMAGLPYVGCGVLASSAAMDKFMTKIILKAYGLPQADYIHCTREQIKKEPSKITALVKKQIGFPCFVKPSNMGSSVGISKVKLEKELLPALRLAANFDFSVLVEKAINAREIECAVLGNKNPVTSVVGEIIPSREFYDYYAKYVDNSSQLLIPAPISSKTALKVKELACKAFMALDGSGMARVDFLMDKKTEALYLNELNTIPGFTGISMYPKLFAAAGIPYKKLLDTLIKLAIERHAERQKNKVSFDSGSNWYK